MPKKVELRHNPELTIEQAMQIFRSHFGNKYKIYRRRVRRRFRFFMIEKSAWTGIRVTLVQTKDATRFDLGSDMPSAPLQVPFIVSAFIPPLWPAFFVFGYIWNRRCVKPLLNEVQQVIQALPELA